MKKIPILFVALLFTCIPIHAQQAWFYGGSVSGTGATITVNSQTCTLGSTCTIPIQTNSTGNTSQAGINLETSSTNSVGLTVTPTNTATNVEKFEVTGTYTGTYGGNAATATNPASPPWSIANGGTNAITATAARISLFPTASEVGDLIYCATYSSGCTSWALLSGNTSGTAWLQETSAGAPSWTVPPGTYALPSQYKIWQGCHGDMLGTGSGANAAITAGTYSIITCYNNTGATVTLTALVCNVDIGTGTTIDAHDASPNDLLASAPLTCSTSYASGSANGTYKTISSGSYIKFTLVPDGVATQIDWNFGGTY